MRITTQMLNEGARKAGLPIHQNSLLNYINKADTGTGSLLDALSSKEAGTGSRAKYEKQEKAANELLGQLQKSTYEKCENAGDHASLYQEAQRLTEKYNRLLNSLNSSPDALDMFYKQGFKDVIASNRSLLEAVGITSSKDGKLHVDSEKMKSASPEKLREVFGGESDFMEKFRFLAERVSDRAGANAKSASGNYSPAGIMNYFSQNKYDFWG